MYYCIATLRKMNSSYIHELTVIREGSTKGSTLLDIFRNYDGKLIFLEELSKEDFELLYKSDVL